MAGSQARTKKCPVCGTVFTTEATSRRLILTSMVDRHIRHSHRDYVKSMRGWGTGLEFLFFGGLLAALFVTQYLVLVSVIWAAALLVGILLRQRTVRRFKQSGREIQGPTTLLSDSDVGLQAESISSDVVIADTGLDRSQDADDILSLTRGLCQRLDITGFVPNVVKWIPLKSSGHCEFGLFDSDEIDLPRTWKSKLEIEELKPIVASSLVYSFKLSRKRTLGLAARSLGSLLLLIFFVFSAAYAFSETVSLPLRIVAGVLALFFIVTPITLSLWLGAGYRQMLWLEADRIAAEAMGSGALVESMTKIRKLGLPDIERLDAGGWKARFSLFPRISRRISNLEPEST